jgi:hypothetical protein
LITLAGAPRPAWLAIVSGGQVVAVLFGDNEEKGNRDDE